jgi:sugar lactone lactonase YvrE
MPYQRSPLVRLAQHAGRPAAASVACDVRAVLGESPLWDEADGLRWLDITGRRLCTMDRRGDTRSVALSRRITAVEPGREHELFALTTGGFGWLDVRSGEVTRHAVLPITSGMTMNDCAIDSHGRCWAGAATHDGERRSQLFRLEGSSVSVQVDGIGMSNGIGWSPDESVMYHVDSTAGTLVAWRYDAGTGDISVPRTLLTVPRDVGMPDGLAVDTDGCVWLAVWGAGQVWQLDPQDGRVMTWVSVPTPLTTSCAFGGARLSTLYVTTAMREGDPLSGLLYAAEVPAKGNLPPRFAGVAP